MIVQSIFMQVLKYLFILLLMVHLLFSFILIRQTQKMTQVVEAQISPFLNVLAILHAAYSFFVLFWAALFL